METSATRDGRKAATWAGAGGSFRHIGGILAIALFGAAQGRADIVYVDASATGSNNGSSWRNAFTHLRSAMGAAVAGDQIWVAAGFYTPSDTNPTVSFELVEGVELYGGFAGWETLLSQRDWRANETILSGDIGRDDVIGSGQFWYLTWDRHTANSGHVIAAYGVGPAAVVDGFTIANGATGPVGTPAGDPLMFGSGIYCISASPTVRNVTFLHNLAAFAHGGAMYVLDGSPLIENCRFLENYVHLGDGGGLYAGGSGAPTIRDCEFARNVTVHGGNGGQGHGGGVALWTSQPMALERCTFDQNLAKHFYSAGGLDAARGAALFNFTGPLALRDCVFTRNQAEQGGGVFTFGPMTMVNCLVTGNRAIPQPNDPYPEFGGDGAGVSASSFAGATIAITNCTIANNSAKKYSGISAWSNARLEVENCVLWGNTATDPEFIGFWESQLTKALGTLGYSCIQFIYGPPKLGEDPLEPAKRRGCIEVNPMFDSGGFALAAGSPCIDAARNTKVPSGVTRDLVGNPRFVDDPATPDTGLGTSPIVDMGAYEFPVAGCYPDCDTGTGIGVLDIFDFLCFQNRYAAGDPYACDCDTGTGPGVCDIFDFLCFQNAFAGGCP